MVVYFLKNNNKTDVFLKENTTDIIYPINLHEAMANIQIQFSSVAQSCLNLCIPMNRSMPGLPVTITISWSSLRLMSIESVMPSSHLILCHLLLLLPPIPLHEVVKVLEFQL